MTRIYPTSRATSDITLLIARATNPPTSRQLLDHVGDRLGRTPCLRTANGISVSLLPLQTLCHHHHGSREVPPKSDTTRSGPVPRLLPAWFLEGVRMGTWRFNLLPVEHTCCRKEKVCVFLKYLSAVHPTVLAGVRATTRYVCCSVSCVSGTRTITRIVECRE